MLLLDKFGIRRCSSSVVFRFFVPRPCPGTMIVMPGLESDQIRYAIQVAQAKGYRQVKVKYGADKFSATLPTSQIVEEEESFAGYELGVPLDIPKDICVTSPSVGHYRAIKDGPTEGDKIDVGDKVGEIIAVGLANDINSTEKGTIVEVCVSDGAAVEYGQPILLLRQ